MNACLCKETPTTKQKTPKATQLKNTRKQQQPAAQCRPLQKKTPNQQPKTENPLCSHLEKKKEKLAGQALFFPLGHYFGFIPHSPQKYQQFDSFQKPSPTAGPLPLFQKTK